MSHKQGPYQNRLKQVRMSLMTQTELSKRLRNRGFKASNAYISLIEAGTKRIPYDLAIAICEEVGLPNKVTDIFLPTTVTDSKD